MASLGAAAETSITQRMPEALLKEIFGFLAMGDFASFALVSRASRDAICYKPKDAAGAAYKTKIDWDYLQGFFGNSNNREKLTYFLGGVGGKSQLKILDLLDFSFPAIPGESLLHFKKFSQLKVLSMNCTNMTEYTLLDYASSTTGLTGLTSLTLSGCPSNALTALATNNPKLRNLEFCNFIGLDINDLITVAERNTQLSRLHSSRQQVNQKAMQALAAMPNLTDLSLASSNVTDAALAELSTASNLTKLNLQTCRHLTMDAILALNQQLPQLYITYKNGETLAPTAGFAAAHEAKRQKERGGK